VVAKYQDDANRPVSDLSDVELRAYACEHVYYEIDMLVRAAGTAEHAQEGWPMNVAIEIFTVHLRNVLDFLYPPNRVWPTDVFARHFFTAPKEWSPADKSEALQVAHLRAHKEVAHLTTGRKSDPEDKLWDMPALCGELGPLVSEFAESADLVCSCFAVDVPPRLSVLPVS
jgi:hypothetical protein